MTESFGDRLVAASARALDHRGRAAVPDEDLRVAVAAALWELAAWSDRRNPEVRLENSQRAAIRDVAQSIDGV